MKDKRFIAVKASEELPKEKTIVFAIYADNTPRTAFLQDGKWYQSDEEYALNTPEYWLKEQPTAGLSAEDWLFREGIEDFEIAPTNKFGMLQSVNWNKIAELLEKYASTCAKNATVELTTETSGTDHPPEMLRFMTIDKNLVDETTEEKPVDVEGVKQKIIKSIQDHLDLINEWKNPAGLHMVANEILSHFTPVKVEEEIIEVEAEELPSFTEMKRMHSEHVKKINTKNE